MVENSTLVTRCSLGRILGAESPNPALARYESALPEIKPMPLKPRCNHCGGETYRRKPIPADRPSEYIVENVCRVCGNTMWQRQVIMAISKIRSTKEGTERGSEVRKKYQRKAAKNRHLQKTDL